MIVYCFSHRKAKYCYWIVLLGYIYASNTFAQFPTNYKGTPYPVSIHGSNIQFIPGRIELAYYDLGGEGIAYHDIDSLNNGARLSYTAAHDPLGVPHNIAFFRLNEGVDITYTKNWVDFIHSNLVDPGVNQMYIGWQEDGEWTNYTIDVKVAGKYKVIGLYGNHDNLSELWVNNQFATKLVLPEDTGYWHIWNKAVLGEITLENKGINLLTLRYNSGANLAYLDFVLLELIE
jgi:hypothetical protein